MTIKYTSKFLKGKHRGIKQGIPPLLISNFNTKKYVSALVIPE